MAKPSGALEIGELKYVVSEAGTAQFDSDNIGHMYFIYRLPLQLPEWANTTPEDAGMFRDDLPCRVKMTQEVYHDISGGAGNLRTKYYLADEDDYSISQVLSSAISPPTWQIQMTDTKYPIDCKEFDNFPGDNVPLFAVAEAQFYYDGDAGNQAEISAVEIETYIDNPDSDEVEYFALDGDKLYGPDFPVSAWHVMNCLCKTMQALHDEAKPIFTTIPVGYAKT